MSIQGIHGQSQLQASGQAMAAADSAPASEESREGAAERARESSSSAAGGLGQLQAYQGSKIDLMA